MAETEETLGRSAAQLERHIVLVGLMGVGKSTIGRRLAAQLGAPFLDADNAIEESAGMSIPDIFASHGESAFREGERKVISRILDRPPLVLATGGGAYMDPQTRALLKEKAITIWMWADIEVLLRRVAKRSNRPLLKQGDPREILTKLIETRHPVYAQADIALESRDEPHDRIVEEIIAQLKASGELTESSP